MFSCCNWMVEAEYDVRKYDAISPTTATTAMIPSATNAMSASVMFVFLSLRVWLSRLDLFGNQCLELVNLSL
jgi:hypothetical protein